MTTDITISLDDLKICIDALQLASEADSDPYSHALTSDDKESEDTFAFTGDRLRSLRDDAEIQQALERKHWHVHSHMGGGYLCDCDEPHAVLTAAERDYALREEKGFWVDFKHQGERPQDIRITGSIRKMHFDIDDVTSMGWYRAVDAWECDEAECLREEDDA